MDGIQWSAVIVTDTEDTVITWRTVAALTDLADYINLVKNEGLGGAEV